jgi:hypothetical protein
LHQTFNQNEYTAVKCQFRFEKLFQKEKKQMNVRMILLVALIAVTAGGGNGTAKAPASRFATIHKEAFAPSLSTTSALSNSISETFIPVCAPGDTCVPQFPSGGAFTKSMFEAAGPVCDPDRPCVPPLFGSLQTSGVTL